MRVTQEKHILMQRIGCTEKIGQWNRMMLFWKNAITSFHRTQLRTNCECNRAKSTKREAGYVLDVKFLAQI
jgi:hypothetical protein